MEQETRFRSSYAWRCGLTFVLAALLALAAAVPVSAAVRVVTNGGTAYQRQFCGGALIDRDSVLTAAHCMEGLDASSIGDFVFNAARR